MKAPTLREIFWVPSETYTLVHIVLRAVSAPNIRDICQTEDKCPFMKWANIQNKLIELWEWLINVVNHNIFIEKIHH